MPFRSLSENRINEHRRSVNSIRVGRAGEMEHLLIMFLFFGHTDQESGVIPGSGVRNLSWHAPGTLHDARI